MTARLRDPEQVILQPVHLSRPTLRSEPGTTLSIDNGFPNGASAVTQDSLQPIRLSSYSTGHMATVSWQRGDLQERDTLTAFSTGAVVDPVRSQEPTQFWWISAEGLTNGRDDSSSTFNIQRDHAPATSDARLGHPQAVHPSRFSSYEHTEAGTSAVTGFDSSRGSSETMSSGYLESYDSLAAPSVSILSIAATHRISPLNLPPASAGVVPLNAFTRNFLVQDGNASAASLQNVASHGQHAAGSAEASERNWLDMTSSLASSKESSDRNASSDSIWPLGNVDEWSLPRRGDNEVGPSAHHEVNAFQATGHSAQDEQLESPQARTMTVYDESDLRDMYRAYQASAIEPVPVEDNLEVLAEWMEQSQRLAGSRDQDLDGRCRSTTPQPRNRHATKGVHPADTGNNSDMVPALSAKSVSFATPTHQQYSEAAKTESRSLLASLLPRLQGSHTRSRLFSTLQRKTSASSNVSLANAHSVASTTVSNENIKRSSTKMAHVPSPAFAPHHVSPSFTMQRGMVRPISIGCELPWAPYIEETTGPEDADQQSRASTNATNVDIMTSSRTPLLAGTRAAHGRGKVKRRWYESKNYVPPDATGSTNPSTVIRGAGIGRCTVAVALKGMPHISALGGPVGRQSDSSIISLDRFLAESCPRTTSPRPSMDEVQYDSRTPTPTPSSLGLDRNTGRLGELLPAVKVRVIDVTIKASAAALDRRGGASVVRTAREVRDGDPKSLLLGLGVGRGQVHSASSELSSFCEPTSAERYAPTKPDAPPRSNTPLSVEEASSTLLSFPVPPPLRSRVDVGAHSPEHHPSARESRSARRTSTSLPRSLRNVENDDQDYNSEVGDGDTDHDHDDDNDSEDEDVFSQPRLREPGDSPCSFRRQGSAMSIVLEEEGEEGEDRPEVAESSTESTEA